MPLPEIVIFAGAPPFVKSTRTNRGSKMAKGRKTAGQSRFAKIAKACAIAARKGGQPYVRCMTSKLKKK